MIESNWHIEMYFEIVLWILKIYEYRKVPIYILEIKEICEKHDEKYQMFCKSHDCPCCRKCIIECHKDCNGIDIIEDIIEPFITFWAPDVGSFWDVAGKAHTTIRNWFRHCLEIKD
jgi:hypothetical protein